MQTQLSPRRNISTSREREREKGKGGQCGSPTSHPSPGKEEVGTTRSAATSPAWGIGGNAAYGGGCSAIMSG